MLVSTFLYRCNHHQKPFTCFQRFSCNQLRWVNCTSLNWMQHCTVTYQIQTRCQLFHCQRIQQYRIFNFIEEGLLSASFCTTVIMILKETDRLFQVFYCLSHLELLTQSNILLVHTTSFAIFNQRVRF